MRRSMQYLGECKLFLALGTGQHQFSLPPLMPPVPSPVWLLTVHSCDVLSRLDEVKVRITSVFGSKNMCNLCGQLKRKDTGHSRIDGTSFCSVASGGKSGVAG
ncbi:hypothetical protein DPEC_G00099840 [Dallia pectoralis]|uniref:Uncharacterized protein n=1 Tax=Dallia pectoralis TaxID=75939 RepID=A0ACC2GWD0_DALPE|nr:hypothetical protein DPEC_G00099840 [Dallia pectoralis]